MALLRLPFLARFALPCLRCRLLACSLACFACLLRLVGCLLRLVGRLLLCWVVLDACALVVVLNCLLWPLGLTAAICCLPWPIPLVVSPSACHAACFGRLPQVLAMPLALATSLRCLPCRLLRPSPSGDCHAACFGRLPQVIAMPPASAVFLRCLPCLPALAVFLRCLPCLPALAVSLSACHASCFGRLPQLLGVAPALAACSIAARSHALPSCLPFGPDCLLRPLPFWLARTGHLDFDLLALDVLRYWQPVDQWEGSSRPGQAVGQGFRSIQARARGK